MSSVTKSSDMSSAEDVYVDYCKEHNESNCWLCFRCEKHTDYNCREMCSSARDNEGRCATCAPSKCLPLARCPQACTVYRRNIDGTPDIFMFLASEEELLKLQKEAELYPRVRYDYIFVSTTSSEYMALRKNPPFN